MTGYLNELVKLNKAVANELKKDMDAGKRCPDCGEFIREPSVLNSYPVSRPEGSFRQCIRCYEPFSRWAAGEKVDAEAIMQDYNSRLLASFQKLEAERKKQ
jgi:uncharacterized protein with PIN domain